MDRIVLSEIIFKGRQNIPWNDVEKYLKRYYGMVLVNKNYNDKIRINASFADEYTQSRYTKHLRGGLAKVKANIVQILPQLVEGAENRRWIENKAEKHSGNANYGWYRYDTFFSVPTKAENEDVVRWNDYRATVIVKINDRGLFLYDIIDIKKEASTPREP